MLGTFPKAFSQAETSQWYFPHLQPPKCAIYQAATSKVYSSRSARPPVQAEQRSVPIAACGASECLT